MSIPQTTCRECGGIGLCVHCGGTGRTPCNHCWNGYVASDNTFTPCYICNGTEYTPCTDCSGSGLCDLCNGTGEEVNR
jgi:hypothetical protein